MRTDIWPLQATEHQRKLMDLTLSEYRRYCRALGIVVLSNWPALVNDPAPMPAVERLMHPTAKNPNPKHRYFHNQFYKFPSYLRRAAINFVLGQVSSFMTRYDTWLDGDRRSPTAKPPGFNPVSGCYPALYAGQLLKLDEDFKVASIKLWDGKEWLWHDVQIKKTRERHKLGELKSPSLILSGKRCHLSAPVKLVPIAIPERGRVCAVDVGINTLATASIIESSGTVVARKFFHQAADIDRRNRRAQLIRRKARKTAKLSRGFCKSLYRKARHINEQIAQLTSRQLVDFARQNGASVIVLENLKGWRPRGGKKRSTMRQKFHNWLHRRLAALIEMKFEEHGGKVEYVYARGTSSWAFDGSGLLKRDSKQYEIATFSTGKVYNCDLNASYNIGARYWAWKLKLTYRKDGQLPEDKSSPAKPRIPVTLSTLWKKREGDTPYLRAA